MNKAFLFAAIILFICVVLFILFKGCSGFVSSIDGEESNSRMIEIVDNYHFGYVDSTIWLKEVATDSYKRVIDGKVDSLSWSDGIIIGFSKPTYFYISTVTSSTRYTNRDSILKLIQQHGIINNKTLAGIPPIQ